jgi:phosphatidylserine decarboxylase
VIVRVRDRRTGESFEEPIFSEKLIRWAYENFFGKTLYDLLLKRRPFTALYGWNKDSRRSVREIAPFVERFDIDLAESEKTLGEFQSFNDFFARRLKEGAREWAESEDSFPSPCEGRLFAIPRIERKTLFPIKGTEIPLAELLRDRALPTRFEGGAAMILRLSPVDYHRFHFPDRGIPGKPRRIAGVYHSVNPIALATGHPIYCRNRRDVTLFESERFGTLLMIEVGAMGVGRIVQTFEPNRSVSCGAEKGYFQFGGSTVVLLWEERRISFDPDLIEASESGIETLVRLGERIGIARSEQL